MTICGSFIHYHYALAVVPQMSAVDGWTYNYELFVAPQMSAVDGWTDDCVTMLESEAFCRA